MKDKIIKQIQHMSNPQDKLNALREELQHLILQEIDRKGAFRHICFLGGTCLRILFSLDRFSEDLDFSLSRNATSSFCFKSLIKAISQSFMGYGFQNEITKIKIETNVQSAFLTFFPFNDFNIPINPRQTLAIKIEIDINPPQGAIESVSPVTGIRLYRIKHYALPSLFSGKLHALLYRQSLVSG